MVNHNNWLENLRSTIKIRVNIYGINAIIVNYMIV